jgi:hypothetical protein
MCKSSARIIFSSVIPGAARNPYAIPVFQHLQSFSSSILFPQSPVQKKSLLHQVAELTIHNFCA